MGKYPRNESYNAYSSLDIFTDRQFEDGRTAIESRTIYIPEGME
jgi:hypothetical protein